WMSNQDTASKKETGGERGSNTLLQGTVWQWFFRSFDFLYHRNEFGDLALNCGCNQSGERASLSDQAI
ncbi:MAG: hypothetical protein WD944_04990, partial [Steroidobacteraceae bacterium]